MKYINKFTQGWWNAFDSFYSQLHDINPQLADNIGLDVLKGAGVEKNEIDSVLFKISFSSNTEQFIRENAEQFN